MSPAAWGLIAAPPPRHRRLLLGYRLPTISNLLADTEDVLAPRRAGPRGSPGRCTRILFFSSSCSTLSLSCCLGCDGVLSGGRRQGGRGAGGARARAFCPAPAVYRQCVDMVSLCKERASCWAAARPASFPWWVCIRVKAMAACLGPVSSSSAADQRSGGFEAAELGWLSPGSAQHPCKITDQVQITRRSLPLWGGYTQRHHGRGNFTLHSTRAWLLGSWLPGSCVRVYGVQHEHVRRTPRGTIRMDGLHAACGLGRNARPALPAHRHPVDSSGMTASHAHRS